MLLPGQPESLENIFTTSHRSPVCNVSFELSIVSQLIIYKLKTCLVFVVTDGSKKRYFFPCYNKSPGRFKRSISRKTTGNIRWCTIKHGRVWILLIPGHSARLQINIWPKRGYYARVSSYGKRFGIVSWKTLVKRDNSIFIYLKVEGHSFFLFYIKVYKL